MASYMPMFKRFSPTKEIELYVGFFLQQKVIYKTRLCHTDESNLEFVSYNNKKKFESKRVWTKVYSE